MLSSLNNTKNSFIYFISNTIFYDFDEYLLVLGVIPVGVETGNRVDPYSTVAYTTDRNFSLFGFYTK